MIIHLIAPKDSTQWLPVWHHCYNIWKSSPYEIKMWHDEDIDKLLKEDDIDFFTNYLNKLEPIYKFDYVRYLILQKFGGAYFDMDIEIIKDFIPLLNKDSIYISEGTSGNYLENCIMISSQINNKEISSIFFERIKDHCKDNILLNHDKCLEDVRKTLYTVGANALSKFVIKQLKYFSINFNVLAFEHFGSLTNSLSFCRHHYTNNWFKNKK
jgi:hypothetical protein